MAGCTHPWYQEQIMVKCQIMAMLDREFGPRPVPMGIVEIKKRENRYLELLRQFEYEQAKKVTDVVRKKITYFGRGKKIDDEDEGIDDMREVEDDYEDEGIDDMREVEDGIEDMIEDGIEDGIE